MTATVVAAIAALFDTLLLLDIGLIGAHGGAPLERCGSPRRERRVPVR
jgi:hypothetical protein